MRVISYNIRGGLGMDGKRDTLRIAEAVRAHSPDIVCFQEVHQRLPWSGWADQPRLLERALGMRFLFQRNVNFWPGGYGLGIATHLPIAAVLRHFLPGGRERRGALEVRLNAPAGEIAVFCTHWGLTEDERDGQADALAECLERAAPRPVLVCGDFNAFPDSPEVRRLLSQSSLRDADTEANRPTYPADAPRARIDFVLLSAHWVLGGVHVPETLASDHLPVVVDLGRV